MKQLLVGVLILVLIGIAGFFYRNAVQQPGPMGACPADAMMCPDGSAVGRVPPMCSFAPCPAGGEQIGTIVPPEGYVEKPRSGVEATITQQFEKPSLSPSVAHIITVEHLGVTPENGYEDDIVRATVFQPSDMPAESIDKFEKVTMGGKTFYGVVIERFEAQVHSAYYLPLLGADGQATDLVVFEIIERDVTDWMEPTLSVKNLPEHAAFLEMLRNLIVE